MYLCSMTVLPKVLEDVVEQFDSLPGVGKKTAFRYVLHLLKQDKDLAENFGRKVLELHQRVGHCKHCFNITEAEICSICSDRSRDASTICVVEDIRDVILFESTEQYRGMYHVLGGVISPMDGIGPNELHIESLIDRVGNSEVKEVIMALNTTMEGDTTNFYIYRKLKDVEIKLSTLARGVSIGGGLEYTDELTLGRSLVNRVQYESTLSRN
jgi:recombination protein RecR